MANNNSHGSPRDITRLIVGLLFGSGVSGLAIGMIQGAPDVRPWGMAVFVLCLIASGLLFWFGERVIARKEELDRDLNELGEKYCKSLDAIGQEVAGYAERPYDALLSIADILRDEIDKTPSADVKATWAKVFRKTTLEMIDNWDKKYGTSS